MAECPLYARIVIALVLEVMVGVLESDAAILAVPGSSCCDSSGLSRPR